MTFSQCDSLVFNYHLFDIGPQCTTVVWNYIGSSCSPAKFNLQGFYFNEVTSNSLHSARVSLNSSLAQFTFPTDLLRGNPLYLRVRGINSANSVCDASLDKFYNFPSLHENGNVNVVTIANTMCCVLTSHGNSTTGVQNNPLYFI